MRASATVLAHLVGITPVTAAQAAPADAASAVLKELGLSPKQIEDALAGYTVEDIAARKAETIAAIKRDYLSKHASLRNQMASLKVAHFLHHPSIKVSSISSIAGIGSLVQGSMMGKEVSRLLTQDFVHPVFARLAAHFAALQVSKRANAFDYNMYVQEAIKQHGLPVDPKIDWTKYLSRVFSKVAPGRPELQEEAVYHILFLTLFKRDILSSFDPSKQNEELSQKPLEERVTAFLQQQFKWRVSEAVNWLRGQSEDDEDVPVGSLDTGGVSFDGDSTSIDVPDTDSLNSIDHIETVSEFKTIKNELNKALRNQGTAAKEAAELFFNLAAQVDDPRELSSIWMKQTGKSYSYFRKIRDLVADTISDLISTGKIGESFKLVQLLHDLKLQERKEVVTKDRPKASSKKTCSAASELDEYEVPVTLGEGETFMATILVDPASQVYEIVSWSPSEPDMATCQEQITLWLSENIPGFENIKDLGLVNSEPTPEPITASANGGAKMSLPKKGSLRERVLAKKVPVCPECGGEGCDECQGDGYKKRTKESAVDNKFAGLKRVAEDEPEELAAAVADMESLLEEQFSALQELRDAMGIPAEEEGKKEASSKAAGAKHPLNFTCTTTNGLYHATKGKKIRIVGISVDYDENEPNEALVNVYFDKKTWDVEKDGYVYSDMGFLKELKASLIGQGLPKDATEKLTYTEAGMQGDNWISLEFGRGTSASAAKQFIGTVENAKKAGSLKAASVLAKRARLNKFARVVKSAEDNTEAIAEALNKVYELGSDFKEQTEALSENLDVPLETEEGESKEASAGKRAALHEMEAGEYGQYEPFEDGTAPLTVAEVEPKSLAALIAFAESTARSLKHVIDHPEDFGSEEVEAEYLRSYEAYKEAATAAFKHMRKTNKQEDLKVWQQLQLKTNELQKVLRYFNKINASKKTADTKLSDLESAYRNAMAIVKKYEQKSGYGSVSLSRTDKADMNKARADAKAIKIQMDELRSSKKAALKPFGPRDWMAFGGASSLPSGKDPLIDRINVADWPRTIDWEDEEDGHGEPVTSATVIVSGDDLGGAQIHIYDDNMDDGMFSLDGISEEEAVVIGERLTSSTQTPKTLMRMGFKPQFSEKALEKIKKDEARITKFEIEQGLGRKASLRTSSRRK